MCVEHNLSCGSPDLDRYVDCSLVGPWLAWLEVLEGDGIVDWLYTGSVGSQAS